MNAFVLSVALQDKVLAVRATHLLGEILQLGNLLLPSQTMHKLQALPCLVALGLDSTVSFDQSARARVAIQNLSAFSRSREALSLSENEVIAEI